MEYTSREQRRALGGGVAAPVRRGWSCPASGDAHRVQPSATRARAAHETMGVSGPLWRKLARFSPRVLGLLRTGGERGDDARSVFQETVLLAVEGTTAAQVQEFLTSLGGGRPATLVPAEVAPNSPTYAEGYAEGCAAVRRASGEILAAEPDAKKQRRMSPVSVVPRDALAYPLPTEVLQEASLVWEFVQARQAVYSNDMIAAQTSPERSARALAFAAEASRRLVILEGDTESAPGATATIFDNNQQLANRVRTVKNVRKMKDLGVQFRDVVYDCDRLAILKDRMFHTLMRGDIQSVAAILPTIDEKYVRWEKRGDKTKGKSGKNNSYFRHMAYGQACCEALRIKRFRDDASSMNFVRKMLGFWRAESFKAIQRSAQRAMVHAGGVATHLDLEMTRSTAYAATSEPEDAEVLDQDLFLAFQDIEAESSCGAAEAGRNAAPMPAAAMEATEEIHLPAEVWGSEPAAFGNSLFGRASMELEDSRASNESYSQEVVHNSVCAMHAQWTHEGDEGPGALDHRLHTPQGDGSAAAADMISRPPIPHEGFSPMSFYVMDPNLVAGAEV